jgi:putative polyhydroxyalkanoate system protein
MPDIHIQRNHQLGLAGARKVAFEWAEQAEQRLDMECTYEEGKTRDEVSFTRSGVSGTLLVTKDHFELHARLGFLLGAFKERIEAEIVKNLDDLVAGTPVEKIAAKAGSKGAAKPMAKTAGKAPAPAKKTPKKT